MTEHELTHLDRHGQARMVDVGTKPDTDRMAIARATVRTKSAVVAAIGAGAVAKGDVLAVARIAGIGAAKRTADLIPLCHPLRIDAVNIDLDLGDDSITIHARVQCHDRTGVEMEALTAASVAALTIYDMCKAMDRAMTIERIELLEKSGGKSGHFLREQD
ncbi:MAG: molybdenum cofactor biosynthesis protein C [Deltaproteobacteria bacterium RIFOXYA12_FULL_58_15]|nr:MAG: molybdenum cofactor biosynthesis protein C [Deltaproteobacteria bacterium RIFOXYA12_FULL_58_15]